MNMESTNMPGGDINLFRKLSHRILELADRGILRVDFLSEVARTMTDFSGADSVEIWIRENNKCFRCEARQDSEQVFNLETLIIEPRKDNGKFACFRRDSKLAQLQEAVLEGRIDSSDRSFTSEGSFWTGNIENEFLLASRDIDDASSQRTSAGELGKGCRSLAVIPIILNKEIIGLIQLKSDKENRFTEEEIKFYEGIAQTVGVALNYRHVHLALRERVKELTCLYGIAQLVERPGIGLEEILHGIVELLPPAWLYPEIAQGRIVIDRHSYMTENFHDGPHSLKADIFVSGKQRGFIEVAYREDRPTLDEGPFLKEERSLIDTIAREVSLIIDRKQVEEEKQKLQNQLMHAERLATIGQLAAGIAHELNEPLGNILGFAQLAKKSSGLPGSAKNDLDKIIMASLHAREVIKKLMLFARQTPPEKVQVNLNRIVEEGLYFFESRCEKEGIELILALSPDMPDITADPAQITQVLVNLVVNAIQAMPNGGKLIIQTSIYRNQALLVIEDTGLGMAEEVKSQIFIPFFTTKGIDRGTGLGLPVVHGIVTSHGGSINVESDVGRGTRFTIRLPIQKFTIEQEVKGDETIR
ncbi:MAG: ATP-binding protein [Acidobacteriota bacterium]